MPTLLASPASAVTELSDAPALPRVAPALAHALARLYSGCGPVALGLRDAPCKLRFRALPQRMGRLDVYRFTIGPQAGTLALDQVAVARLLDERQVDRLPRELRAVLWADALHPLTQALERALRLRFEWSLPDGAHDAAAADAHHAAGFELQIGAHTYEGLLQFDDAGAFDLLLPLLPPPEPASRHALRRLRLPLPFCLGQTQIALREVAGVRPGDLLSIEQWRRAGTGIEVTADFQRAGRRLIGRAEGERITLQETKDLAMNTDTAATRDDAHSPLPLDRLDALEVSLRFEVGDLSLSLGELKSLQPGHVFELGQPLNRSLVRILAHGNVLGKGHLVAVGERLGVRVTEFAPSEI